MRSVTATKRNEQPTTQLMPAVRAAKLPQPQRPKGKKDKHPGGILTQPAMRERHTD